jgi:hypothetical protein
MRAGPGGEKPHRQPGAGGECEQQDMQQGLAIRADGRREAPLSLGRPGGWKAAQPHRYPRLGLPIIGTGEHHRTLCATLA